MAGSDGRFAATFTFKLKGNIVVNSHDVTSIDEKFYFVGRPKIAKIQNPWISRSKIHFDEDNSRDKRRTGTVRKLLTSCSYQPLKVDLFGTAAIIQLIVSRG